MLQAVRNRQQECALDAISFCSNITPTKKAFKTALEKIGLFYDNKMEQDGANRYPKWVTFADMKQSNSQSLDSTSFLQSKMISVQFFSETASVGTVRKIVKHLPFESRKVRDLMEGSYLPLMNYFILKSWSCNMPQRFKGSRWFLRMEIWWKA